MCPSFTHRAFKTVFWLLVCLDENCESRECNSDIHPRRLWCSLDAFQRKYAKRCFTICTVLDCRSGKCCNTIHSSVRVCFPSAVQTFLFLSFFLQPPPLPKTLPACISTPDRARLSKIHTLRQCLRRKVTYCSLLAFNWGMKAPFIEKGHENSSNFTSDLHFTARICRSVFT